MPLFTVADRHLFRRRALWIVTALTGVMTAHRAHAASLSWDPLSKKTTGSDGSGVWNTSNAIWSNGSIDVSWTNSSPATAIFGAGGTGMQTVALNANMNAAGLTFNPGPAYQLSGNSINLSNNATVTVNNTATLGSNLIANTSNIAFNVTRASAGDLLITGNILGDYGLTKTGPGAVILQGYDDGFAGNVNINAGTLVATQGESAPTYSGSLGNYNLSGRTITVGSGATLLLTDSSNANAADIFGNGAAGGGTMINQSNGTYTPDPNMPLITINGGTLSSTRYNPLGNVILNGGTLTQASTDTAFSNSANAYYYGYQFIGSVTVAGTMPSVIAATPNSLDGSIGGDHLGPETIFNVSRTSSTSGTVDLLVSSPLIDQSTDFENYVTNVYSPGKLTKTGLGTMSLTATNQFSGGTNVIAGTLIFAAPGALPIDSALTIGSGATAIAANHGTGPKNSLFASLLTIAGSNNAWTGKLDLTNNDLDVQNGNLAQLTNQLKQGYNAGGSIWNGSDGIVSSSAAGDSRHLTALGITQNSIDGSPTAAALYTTFDAISVSSTDVLIKYTYYGDANLDGKVDGSDYARIDSGNLSYGSQTGWANGDFNYDGVINGSDYTLIDNAFNTQGATLAASLASPEVVIAEQISGIGAGTVPEPATNIPVLMGVLCLRRRRRSGPCPLTWGCWTDGMQRF